MDEKNTVLAGIARIFHEALTCETEEDLGRVCLAVAEEITQSEFGFIGEVNARTGKLEDIAISDPGWEACGLLEGAGHGKKALPALEIQGIHGRVLTEEEGFYTNSPSSHPDSIGTPPGHPCLTAFLGVPLSYGGKAVGVLGLGNREGGYGPEDLEAALSLAPTIVQAFVSKRSEKAQRESAQRLKAALDASGGAVYAHRVPFDESTFHDERWVDLIGYENDELPRYDKLLEWFFDLAHPEDRERLMRAYYDFVEGKTPRYYVETRLRHKKGHWVWVEKYSCAPERDENGKVTRVVGVVTDISERKWAEQELERERSLLESIMQATDVQLAYFDRDFNFVRVNPAYAKSCGMEIDELVGKNHFELFPHAENEKIFRRVRDTGVAEFYKDKPFQYRGQPKRGITYWDWSLVPVKEASQAVRGLVFSLRETTEKKHTEDKLREANLKLRETDRLKNDFLGALSHELRNPLAPIKYGLSLLDASFEKEQDRKALEVIDRQVNQLTDLVNDLLDVTRITQNKIRMNKQRLNLVEIVRSSIEDNWSLFEQAGVRLESVPHPGPIWVNADGTRLCQVINNVLQNAAKFSRPGGTTHVFVAERGPEAVVRVVDDGVGMTQQTLERLFEPFVQAEQGLDRDKGGLGLGLALSKSLIESHGGSISAHSMGLGKGAELRIRLPIERGEAQKPKIKKVFTKPHPRRVLIIEDLLDAAESLSMILKRDGHEVVIAGDGPEGIDKAQSFRPEVVFCDIGLPGMDGYEVAKLLRGDSRLENAFLIALSGYAQPEDLDRACRAGFDEHIAKPPSLKRIRELLVLKPENARAVV